MIINAYTLYDSKALTYSPPFYATAHGSAVRMVMELAGDQSTSIGRHPGDFTLYCVGTFDDARGLLSPSEVRQHVSDVVALVPPRAAPLFDPGADHKPGVAANGDLSKVGPSA